MINVITYDLHNPGRDYQAVHEYIKRNATSWAHPQDSVWFVDTPATPEAWVRGLMTVTDENDEFFVTRFRSTEWTSIHMDAKVVEWLKSSARSW
jgi:hypothetical protein